MNQELSFIETSFSRLKLAQISTIANAQVDFTVSTINSTDKGTCNLSVSVEKYHDGS